MRVLMSPNKQEFPMDKRTLDRIIETHCELATIWRQVADERCRDMDTWGVHDAVKRSMAHEREIRALKMRFANVEA